MYALDKCYDIDKPRPFYIHRPLAVLLTIVVATLIISVIALVPVATIIRNLVLEFAYFESVNATLLFLFDFTRWLLALMLMFLALALVYHFGPSFRGKWVSITPGAVFCVAVWILLGFGFKFYVDRFGKYDETYGTVGGVAVLLLLMYIDAVVLLIGAEINSEIDFAVLNLPRGVEEFPREALEQDTEEEAQEVAREAVEEKEAGDSKDE
jgi:membrane protein